MELHYLKLFHTIASLGSITKASEHLYISQPSLSVQLKKLEDSLGLKLFDKVGNKLLLNENGKLLLSYTSQIFDLLEEAHSKLLYSKENIGGVLYIGGSNTPGAYILPKIMGQFKALYPSVTMHLHIGNTDEIAHLINEGTLDFAINGGTITYPPYVKVMPLMKDPLVLIASPESHYAKLEKITPDTISSASFIIHATSSQLYNAFTDVMNELHITPSYIMSIGNIDAIKEAVSANLGLSFIPYSAVEKEVSQGELVILNLEDYHPTYPYSLIYHSNKFLSPAALKLLEMVKEHGTLSS